MQSVMLGTYGQVVRHLTFNRKVVGSRPISPSKVVNWGSGFGCDSVRLSTVPYSTEVVITPYLA